MLVRLVNGGGKRNIDISVDSTKAEVINQLKAVFSQTEHVFSEKHMRCNFPLESLNTSSLFCFFHEKLSFE